MPPKWFYDSVGSDLFDQITRLPEYYPTRAEAQILRDAVGRRSPPPRGADTLVELGSGTSEKTRMLLDALRDSGSLRRFVPFDVDAGVLESAGAAHRSSEYPGIEIDAVCGDFEEHLGKIPGGGRRLVVFLGSTIGNLTPGRAPSSWPRWPTSCSRATRCCWAPTWSRTPTGWSAPTTTARA